MTLTLHITTQKMRLLEIHVHDKNGSNPLKDEEIRATSDEWTPEVYHPGERKSVC